MLKAHERITRSLATCAPDTRVADVATAMRDCNIRAVLVVEGDELRRALLLRTRRPRPGVDRFLASRVGADDSGLARLEPVGPGVATEDDETVFS